jgi:tetratricopeptide (TPR) repeat protein
LKAVEQNPSYNLAYYNIGKLYWSKGDDEKAVYYLKLFAEKAGSDPMRPYALKIISKINANETLKIKSPTECTMN